MGEFKEGYRRFCDNLPAGMAAERAVEWVEGIDEAVVVLEGDLADFYGNRKSLNALGGDAAEFWHASTYNINRAAARDAGPLARVPRSNVFASLEIDLVDVDGNGVERAIKSYQAKYYADAEKSAKAQAATYGHLAHSKQTARQMIDAGLARQNDPVYGSFDRLVPTDQVDDAKDWLHKQALKEASKRPEQVYRYENTEKKTVGHVDGGRGYQSDDLSKADSRNLAQEARDGKFDPEKWGLTAGQKITPEMLLEDSVRTP
ncbi:hypothetical protein [Paratractidigestivibacter sp.]|uniref:hypothetical protein n=1 Tax=Paratractidigestivibacter sp. TaxID=2847316 RepID=UPI002ABE5B11|nr:hypothetical protein [Paratractidigestivibacter sp.]